MGDAPRARLVVLLSYSSWHDSGNQDGASNAPTLRSFASAWTRHIARIFGCTFAAGTVRTSVYSMSSW
jgi:hypothetical protein